MGLDWVVIARTEGAIEVNPTEEILAKRATRDDPEVPAELRRYWESQESPPLFDEFLVAVCDQEIPPVVIRFGKGREDSRPLFPAEAQYYGYRGKALEPGVNSASDWLAAKGHSFDWLYEDLETQEEIEERARILRDLLSQWSSENPEVLAIANEYMVAFRAADTERTSEIDEKLDANPEVSDTIFDTCAYISAIDWLGFWSGRGFTIAADY